MARKKYGQETLRFTLADEKERRLYKLVNSLDKSIYGSKNSFIISAIEAYIDGNQSGFSEEGKNSLYVTREEFQTLREKMKNEIRIELYQELIVFLAKSGVSAALINANAMHSMDTTSNPVEDITTNGNTQDNIPAEMLADIEKWS